MLRILLWIVLGTIRRGLAYELVVLEVGILEVGLRIAELRLLRVILWLGLDLWDWTPHKLVLRRRLVLILEALILLDLRGLLVLVGLHIALILE